MFPNTNSRKRKAAVCTADQGEYAKQLILMTVSALYGAILTVQTIPVSIYRAEMVHVGKAAAKEAVTRAALEGGIIQKLKDTMLIRRTGAPAPPPAILAPAAAAAALANATPSGTSEPTRPPFSERLDGML